MAEHRSPPPFPHRVNLCEGPQSYAYPTAIQTQDDTIHVVYTTDERTTVRRISFTESAFLKQAKTP